MSAAGVTNRPLACPFCGEFPELVRPKVGNVRHRIVRCSNRACEIRPETRAAPVNTAAQIWNRRLAGRGPDVRDAARGGGAEWVPLPILRKLGHAAQVLRAILLRETVKYHQGEPTIQVDATDVGIIHDPELAAWLGVAVHRNLLDQYPPPSVVPPETPETL